MAKINFKPNEDRVLVEPAEAETKTASGIIIPDTAKEKPQKGKIIAVGEGVKDKPVTVKVGDNVLYGKLSKDWLTQGLIDFEYKKYVLMAYLQRVKTFFNRVELYPFMADLVFHYRNLLTLKENKTLIRESFPKELSLEDFKKLELSYRQMIADDNIMSELESIIDFALPQIKGSLNEGSVIYEFVESKCEISPVGLTPLYAKEGYLFVTQPPEKETNIYRYQVSIF